MEVERNFALAVQGVRQRVADRIMHDDYRRMGIFVVVARYAKINQWEAPVHRAKLLGSATILVFSDGVTTAVTPIFAAMVSRLRTSS